MTPALRLVLGLLPVPGLVCKLPRRQEAQPAPWQSADQAPQRCTSQYFLQDIHHPRLTTQCRISCHTFLQQNMQTVAFLLTYVGTVLGTAFWICRKCWQEAGIIFLLAQRHCQLSKLPPAPSCSTSANPLHPSPGLLPSLFVSGQQRTHTVTQLCVQFYLFLQYVSPAEADVPIPCYGI